MSESIYSPTFDYNTYEQEDKLKYLYRIKPLLPNFPEDVILQWFYDHPQQVHMHEWLSYPTLRFELCNWKIDKIPIHNYGKDAAVETYMYNYFTRGVTSQRRERLETYFLNNGTWPVPPIFLLNKDGLLKYPIGFPCGVPLHLLEGHNQMAFFIEFKKRGQLAATHLVYIVSQSNISMDSGQEGPHLNS